MPCALADAWFEEKLNSVSISFWRQTMGKSRDGKKEDANKSAVKGSPITRSKREQLTREGGSGAGNKAENEQVVKKKKTKSGEKVSDSVKGAAAGPSGDGDSVATPKPGQESLDIPSLLYDVERRVQRKQNFETIAESMPLANKAWTLMNIHKFVRTLSLKFTEQHYLACGFSVTEIELFNKLRKQAREEKKSASRKRSSSVKGDVASTSGSASKKVTPNESGAEKRPATSKSGEEADMTEARRKDDEKSDDNSLIKEDDVPPLTQLTAVRSGVETRQEATGGLKKEAPITARTDVSANETDSATAPSLAKSGLMMFPQGNKWVVQDDKGRS